MSNVGYDLSFWRGKRVFLTAPTSFLGAWTAMSLRHLGAQVFGFSEASSTSPNLFDLANLGQHVAMTYGDPRDEALFRQALQNAEADIVIHLGESGLLREGEKNSYNLISKSVLSTTLLMELLRETASVRAVVVLSSDKVYERSSDNSPLTEEHKIAAQDIFPTAKLCSELIALSYRKSFFNPEKYNKHKIAVATARLGVGIGGGDFSSTSLVPQAAQSFHQKTPLELRNPLSVRPWIHVLDQVAGVLALAQALVVRGPKLAATYNLGASEFHSVQTFVQEFSRAWGQEVLLNSSPEEHGNFSLHGQLNSELARRDLQWRPQWNLTEALSHTARWYRDYFEGVTSGSLDRDVRDFFV